MEQVLFGERLENARKATGMSQKAMASRIGVKKETVKKWESGKVHPRGNRLQMLASMLNVPLLWLLAGSQKVPDPTAGTSNSELMLQKIAVLSDKIDKMKLDLDDLNLLAQAGD